LLRRGAIDRLPRLYAVQPAHCAPLHAGFAAGSEEAPPVDPRPTLAEGASIAKPVRGREVLAALRRSGGGTVAVSEEAIEAALHALARTGLYVEPTCALAAAALDDLTANGAIRADETTVVVLTGTGIKATPRIADLLGVAS
jgi:threonine synthase